MAFSARPVRERSRKYVTTMAMIARARRPPVAARHPHVGAQPGGRLDGDARSTPGRLDVRDYQAQHLGDDPGADGQIAAFQFEDQAGGRQGDDSAADGRRRSR